MATTRMMCLHANFETKYNQALEKADNFVVNGDILLLNDANKKPLARFEVVYLR
jgi:heat shock protein HslJ